VINIDQRVDFLWKKLGYGVAKTDVPSIKDASNESITSSPFLPGNKIWVETDAIPSVIPAASTAVVTVETVQCVMDITATDNRTWLTGHQDWIPIEFGSTYLVKVYLAPSTSTQPHIDGGQFFSAGSNNDDEWFFDYEAGVLHFIGNNLPNADFTGASIFISGARYTGAKGLGNLTSGTFGNLSLSGITLSSTGNIILDPATATGNVSVSNATITNLGYPIAPTDAASVQYVLDTLGTVQANAITQGDTSVVITDTGVNGAIAVTVDGAIVATITSQGVTATSVTAPTLSSAADLTLSPAPGSVIATTATTALQVPTGTSGDRPATPAPGYLRYNTTLNIVEYYDGSQWSSLTPLTDTQIIVGDDSTTNFTLNHPSTETDLMVSINGVLQTPGTAYTVVGNTIAFVEPILSSEVVVIRFISVSIASNASLQTTSTVSPPTVIVDTSAATLDTFNFALYRAAKYTVSVTYNDDNAQMYEIMLTHNGYQGILTSVNTVHDVRSTMSTGGTGAMSFNSYAWAGACVLTATSTLPNTKVKVQKTYIES